MVGYSLGTAGLLVSLVQGLLIRVINPRLGPNKSVYTGMILYVIGLALFAFAWQGWMMFAFLVPYCLGGITGPAIQGIMSNQLPDTEQGELQGIFAGMVSITSIIGPPLMTGLFAFFTSPATPVHFPGAPFLLGALLTVVVQSSTATTVTLIGFVSAGLIKFGQSLGVVMGASLGTTGIRLWACLVNSVPAYGRSSMVGVA